MKQLRLIVTALMLSVCFLLVLSACRGGSAKTNDTAAEPVGDAATSAGENETTAEPETEQTTEPESETEAVALTVQEAYELWKNANTLYAKWFVLPESDLVDLNDSILTGKTGDTSAYRVTQEGINTKQELAGYLSRYFAPEVYEPRLESFRFVEQDGGLYIVAGGIGSDMSTLNGFRLKAQTEDQATVELIGTDNMIGGGDFTMELTLRRQDGRWLFDDPFYCFYDDLTYDGIAVG